MRFRNISTPIVAVLLAAAGLLAREGNCAEQLGAHETLSPSITDNIQDTNPILLRPAGTDEKLAALELSPLNNSITVEAKDPAHLSILQHRRSKGLGTKVDVVVATLWLDAGALYFKWSGVEQAKAAVDELKYAAVRLETADQTIVVVCQFVPPQKLAFKLRGVETAKITAPAEIFAKLKLEPRDVPAGWEQAPTADGNGLELRAGQRSFSFQFVADASVLKSVATGGGGTTAAPAAGDDPQKRLASMDREIRASEEDLKHKEAALHRARTYEEGTSIRKSITIVENRIRQQRDIRAKIAAEAGAAPAPVAPVGPTAPHGGKLLAVLPNGVWIAEVALE